MTDPGAVTVSGCGECGAIRLPDERFCEACGTPLPPAGRDPVGGGVAGEAPDGSAAASPPGAPAAGEVDPSSGPTCTSCGTTGQFADAYCLVCGLREPRPRDHEERAGAGWAGVTDRGRRHHRNEDAFTTADRADGPLVVVVSDGVSTTQRPDEASAAAVVAAAAVLGAPGHPDFAAALQAARDAVVALDYRSDDPLGAPSCTLLMAVVGDGDARLAALGDCRAYWIPGGDGRGARQVTTDDSWATEQLRAGSIPADEIWADPRAHTITRWLGADGDPAWEPHLTRLEPEGPGRLILCSDGLWNYLPEPGDLVAAIGERAEGMDIARALTDFANGAGGHDNITVVVVDWPRPRKDPA